MLDHLDIIALCIDHEISKNPRNFIEHDILLADPGIVALDKIFLTSAEYIHTVTSGTNGK